MNIKTEKRGLPQTRLRFSRMGLCLEQMHLRRWLYQRINNGEADTYGVSAS